MAVYYEPPLQDNICPVKGYYYTLLEGTPIYAFNCGEIIKLKPNAGWTFNEYSARRFIQTGRLPKFKTLINEIHYSPGPHLNFFHKGRHVKLTNFKFPPIIKHSISLEEAYAEIYKLLTNYLKQISKNKNLKIPLSAGYDSNTILHLASRTSAEITTYTSYSKINFKLKNYRLNERPQVEKILEDYLGIEPNFICDNANDLAFHLHSRIDSLCMPYSGIISANWTSKINEHGLVNEKNLVLSGWGGNLTTNLKAFPSTRYTKTKQIIHQRLSRFHCKDMVKQPLSVINDWADLLRILNRRYYSQGYLYNLLGFGPQGSLSNVLDQTYEVKYPNNIVHPLINKNLLSFIYSLPDDLMSNFNFSKKLLASKFYFNDLSSLGIQNASYLDKELCLNLANKINIASNQLSKLSSYPSIENLMLINYLTRAKYVDLFRIKIYSLYHQFHQ